MPNLGAGEAGDAPVEEERFPSQDVEDEVVPAQSVHLLNFVLDVAPEDLNMSSGLSGSLISRQATGPKHTRGLSFDINKTRKKTARCCHLVLDLAPEDLVKGGDCGHWFVGLGKPV